MYGCHEIVKRETPDPIQALTSPRLLNNNAGKLIQTGQEWLSHLAAQTYSSAVQQDYRTGRNWVRDL